MKSIGHEKRGEVDALWHSLKKHNTKSCPESSAWCRKHLTCCPESLDPLEPIGSIRRFQF